MSRQPKGAEFHHSGSVLARPVSLTTMAIRSTDATLSAPGQDFSPYAPATSRIVRCDEITLGISTYSNCQPCNYRDVS